MYHRQVYKILLSNRVLEDPRQRRLFRTTDLTELFNLNEPIPGGSSESDQLFRTSKLSPDKPNFSSNEIAAMKKLAAELSKKIGEKASTNKLNCDEVVVKAGPTNEIIDEPATKLTDDSVENLNVKSNDQMEVDSENIRTNTEPCQNTISDDNEFEDEKLILGKELSVESEKSDETKEKKNSEVTNLNKSAEDKEEIEDGEISSNSCKDSSKLRQNEKVKKSKTKQKHKKSKKSKPENEISAMFEGERVSCLIGRRLGKSQEPDPVATADDQYVLSKLFSKSGTHFLR